MPNQTVTPEQNSKTVWGTLFVLRTLYATSIIHMFSAADCNSPMPVLPPLISVGRLCIASSGTRTAAYTSRSGFKYRSAQPPGASCSRTTCCCSQCSSDSSSTIGSSSAGQGSCRTGSCWLPPGVAAAVLVPLLAVLLLGLALAASMASSTLRMSCARQKDRTRSDVSWSNSPEAQCCILG